MTDEIKLGICALGSVVFHLALKHGLDYLPPRHDPAADQKVTIQVVEPPPPMPAPPPPPEPEKQPEPTPTPKIVPHEAPVQHPVKAPIVAAVAKDTPPSEHAVTTDTQDEPVFGVSMSSTSPTGTGPAMPVGNTTRAENTGSAAPVKALAPPIAAFEATKMPLPQGRCFGKYTDEARTAGDEGTVVLDLVVDETGHAREIHATGTLPHGLTEAAIKALQDCRFTPGEKDGKAVPVKIRGFKIHFVLSEAQ